MMTDLEFGRCVHPREMPRLLLALLFAVPISLVIAAATLLTPMGGVVLSVIFLICFLLWFAYEIFYALLLGNWILVSEDNYPRLHDLLQEMKQRIGIANNVDIIVYEQAAFASFFQMLFARRAIFITSELVAQGVTDDELRWLIGRWVGYMRSKRRLGPLRLVVALVQQIPALNLFIFPYERATVYTGDRVGLAAVDGDISTAISTMNKLMVGREVGYSVNPAGMVRQHRRVKGSFFGFLARLMSPLPHMTARYIDLIGFAEREYPSRAEEFANMNPSFQTSGGAWQLMRSTEKKGDGTSNLVGVGFLAGAIVAPFVIAFAWMAVRGGTDGVWGLLSFFNRPNYSSSYETYPEAPAEAYDPAAEPAAPAAAGPYEIYNLSAEVAAAVTQARTTRSYAESTAAEARQAADNARNYGSSNPSSGSGYFDPAGDFQGDRAAGEIADYRMHGLGVYEWAVNANNSDSGSGLQRYEGRFENGAMSGYGVASWRNGVQYMGAYAAGNRDGYGVMAFGDGRLYEGQWSNGQQHGYGVEWDANGYATNAGYWSNGAFIGSG